jgi:hypothetical protein
MTSFAAVRLYSDALVIALVDHRVGVLEVVPIPDLAPCLVECVAKLLAIELRDDVERR